MSSSEFLAARGIEHDRLPAYVLDKAQSIIQKLEAGTHFQALKGKRMAFQHSVISIPVGLSHRIIAIDNGGMLKVRNIVTHEKYNNLIKRIQA